MPAHYKTDKKEFLNVFHMCSFIAKQWLSDRNLFTNDIIRGYRIHSSSEDH